MARSAKVRNFSQCEIDPGIHLASDFSSIRLHPFVSPGLGIVFEAPEHWEDTSGEHFQVTDTDNGTEFTGNGYPRSMSLQQWADLRLGSVAKGIPSMKAVKPPYGLQLSSLPGIAAEYRGVFPGYQHESHYLILCLCREDAVASFSISTTPRHLRSVPGAVFLADPEQTRSARGAAGTACVGSTTQNRSNVSGSYRAGNLGPVEGRLWPARDVGAISEKLPFAANLAPEGLTRPAGWD